jgi:hypothetical protein
MIIMLPSTDRTLAEMEWYSNVAVGRSRYLMNKEFERRCKEAVLAFYVAGEAGSGALPICSSIGTGGFFLDSKAAGA